MKNSHGPSVGLVPTRVQNTRDKGAGMEVPAPSFIFTEMIKMLMDFHVHTDSSSDSKMSVREAYEAAAGKGIKNICITNHHEPFEARNGDFRQSLTDEKIQKFRDGVEEMRKDGRVNIFLGIEMTYTEEEEEQIKDILSKCDFDYVLGSIHYIKGVHFGHYELREQLKDADHAEFHAEYFRVLKKAISSGLFDAIGHIDIYKRVLPEPDIETVRAAWEEIGELLAKTKVGFEINTSHARDVPYGIYPDIEIVKILLSKGVKIVVVGSDAHSAKSVGRNIEKVEKMLRDLGVEEIYYFDKRKPVAMQL
jgi:histidinol-phosphatase (PHP family)